MDGVGKVNRRRIDRQPDQIALRSKAEHLIVVHLKLGILKKLLRVGSPFQNLQQLADPAEIFAFRLLPLFVGPVGGNAFFRDFVHFKSAYLHLNPGVFRPDDTGMNRLVTVWFRS